MSNTFPSGRGRRVSALAGLAAGVLALSACGGGSSSSSGDGPSGEPQSGGVLQVMAVSEPRTLDPATIINMQGLGEVAANALYGTLVVNDPKTGEVKPSMAESLESTDGGTTWELVLREGLEFSDGTPLDAADVKYGWERIADPAVGAPIASVVRNDIESIETVDDLTMKFTLTKPQVRFDGVLLTSALNWVAKPEALKEGVEAFDKNPIGAGPYKLKAWNRGSSIELVANDNYFEEGKPYLDGITIRTVPDPNQRVDSIAAGDAHLAPASSPVARAKGETAGLQVHNNPVHGGNIILLNATRPPFDDVRAREAVVKAVDQEALNQAVAQGHGEIVSSLFRKGSIYDTGGKVQEHDADRAQELFDELAAEGKPVKFTITAALNPDLAEAVQTQLRSFDNVTVEVRKVEAAESTTRLLDASYEALTNGAPIAQPEVTYHTWFHTNSAMHPGRPADPELEALIDKARVTTDEAEIPKVWKQIEERVAQDYAMIWTIQSERAYLASNDVGGVSIYGGGSLPVADLWLAQ